jgi:hypothetical protein
MEALESEADQLLYILQNLRPVPVPSGYCKSGHHFETLHA